VVNPDFELADLGLHPDFELADLGLDLVEPVSDVQEPKIHLGSEVVGSAFNGSDPTVQILNTDSSFIVSKIFTLAFKILFLAVGITGKETYNYYYLNTNS
jgi:hypothetical protein